MEPESFAERKTMYCAFPRREETGIDPDDCLLSTDDLAVEESC
ncbi:hypothetical protein [Streptomyces sp. NPDC046976]